MLDSSPLLLIILDGWGHQQSNAQNAITLAKTPVWDKLWSIYPHTLISASGLDVGLPEGQMGNSEVGHMTLGAGRIIYQDLTLINIAIANKSFFQNQVLTNALTICNQKKSALHIMGLLSPGGVHSHEQQIFAMIEMAIQQHVEKIYIHVFLDGRDTPPKSANNSLLNLQKICDRYPNVKIASIIGRFYAMDRDKRIERTNIALALLAHGTAEYVAPTAIAGLDMAYARGETDEFVKPTQITLVDLQDNDVVIFMNFRSDRARQLSYGLTNLPIKLSAFVTLTEYDPLLPAQVAFPKQKTNMTLGEILQQNNLNQLRIAETEKYAHVTFFFNAGREEPFENEQRILIPSPQVATYDLSPGMSAEKITHELIQAIKNKIYQVIICNFANADMLGHTGNLQATIKSIEILDKCLGEIVDNLTQFGGQALITADHGNAEIMWDSSANQPHTAHTANLVPLVYVGPKELRFKTGNYGLKDVAPTILTLLNLPQPPEMTGTAIIDNKTIQRHHHETKN